MPHHLDTWVPLEGSPEKLADALRDPPPLWLPEPVDERGPGHWGFPVHAGPVTRMATCRVGDATGAGTTVRRHLHWQADPEPHEPGEEAGRSLPSFVGTLELRHVGERRVDLRLDGAYEAPEGPIGAALNPSQVRLLAETSVRQFLADVADRLLAAVED